jgi:hypothetical protein
MVDSLIQEVGVNPAALPSANEQATAVRNLGPGMSLPNPFAGVSDFGTKQVPIENEQGVVGYETQPMTALEWLSQNVDAANPIYQALVGHTSTSITPYTDVNGNQFYHIAGKTGGPDRERYAQMYAVQGDQLVPVGEGQFYKGEHPDQAFKDFVGMAAGLLAAPVLGPYASAIGDALGITNAAVAQVVGQGIINTSIQVAQGVPIKTAIKQNIASSLIPNVVGNPIIDNAVRAAAGAQLMGGDVENAVVNSLIASGAQSLAGDLSITGDRTIDSGLVSGGTSIAQALATGGDPGQSFIQGFTRGASTAINQDEARAARAASGAGFVGEYEDLSGAGPVDYVMGERDPALVQAGFFNNALGLTQSAFAELGRSWLAAGQQVGIAPEKLQIGIDWLKSIEDLGAEKISPAVRQQQEQFAQQIYSVASNPNASTADIAQAIIRATGDNPLGAFTLVTKEIIQELPQLLIPGRAAALIGSFALNIAESAGNQALEKIDELRRANPGMSNQELIDAAKKDSGIAAAVTAAVSLIPGANTKALQPLVESASEFFEAGLTKYLTTGDINAARGSAFLEGVISGKTTGAIQTGEQLVNAAQQNVPSLGTITVRSTPLPADQTPAAGGTLAIEPVVAARTGGQQVIPSAPNTAVVISTDPASNTALVIDSSGATKIVSATDTATGAPVTQGQSLTITASNQLTSGGGPASAPTIIPSGPSALDMQNIMASSQYGQGAVNRPTTGAAQVTVGGTPAGVQPTTPAVSTMPIPGGGTQPVTSGSQAEQARAEAERARQAEIAARNFADLQSRTYKGQVYATAEEAANARLADTAPKTPAAIPAYSANVPATPEVVAELLALKGLPSSPGAIRILLAGNPTVAQVGQEIEVLSEMVRQRGVTQQPSTQPAGTPTVSTGQQGGPTVITQGGTETKPATQPTTTPATRPTTTSAVTPTTQPSVTETIDLTGTTGRVNIDTVSPIDTTGQDTTFLDTTPTGTRPVDTGPALDTGPAEETVPTYGEDDDIIRFLGLDRIEEQPVERAEPVAEPEDTTPGAVAGPADVATEEQLAIAPRPVYTPKPGTRVVDTGSSILPTRVQLSEGMGDDVEGTGEEEQQPVWNVRSLKLRRALGI